MQATAEIYLYGAHVTSWTVSGKELLFLSKEAIFKPPKAIRWAALDGLGAWHAVPSFTASQLQLWQRESGTQGQLHC